MDLGAPGSSGLLGSLRGFADNLFGSVQDRLELLSVELQEEKQRLVQTLLWGAVFIVCAVFAALFVSLAVLVAVWHTSARVPVAVGLAALYSGAALWVGLRLRRHIARQPKPFAGSLEELRSDLACLRSDN